MFLFLKAWCESFLHHLSVNNNDFKKNIRKSVYLPVLPVIQKLWSQKPLLPAICIFCFQGAANQKRVALKGETLKQLVSVDR